MSVERILLRVVWQMNAKQRIYLSVYPLIVYCLTQRVTIYQKSEYAYEAACGLSPSLARWSHFCYDLMFRLSYDFFRFIKSREISCQIEHNKSDTKCYYAREMGNKKANRTERRRTVNFINMPIELMGVSIGMVGF